MAITAAMVKELREMTGAGMMDCKKALTAAENCTHTMHNLYTLRGAKARDPL